MSGFGSGFVVRLCGGGDSFGSIRGSPCTAGVVSPGRIRCLGVGHHYVTGAKRESGLVAPQPGGAVGDEPFGLRLQPSHPRVAVQAGGGPHVEVHAVLGLRALR
jgi:hypothetical protein